MSSKAGPTNTYPTKVIEIVKTLPNGSQVVRGFGTNVSFLLKPLTKDEAAGLLMSDQEVLLPTDESHETTVVPSFPNIPAQDTTVLPTNTNAPPITDGLKTDVVTIPPEPSQDLLDELSKDTEDLSQLNSLEHSDTVSAEPVSARSKSQTLPFTESVNE